MAYTNAVYFLDYELGSDAARADLVPSSYSNNGSGLVRVTVGSLGTPNIVTDAVVTIAGTTGSIYAGSWKVTVINSTTIDLQNSTYTSNPATKGTCVPFGGDSWANAWKTITTGATSTRIAAGDTVRIAKSPAPINTGVTGKWTAGPVGASVYITGTSNNAGSIRITAAGHGLVTGDVVYITGVYGTLEANGAWLVTYDSATQFTLQNSVYTNAWSYGGTVKNINANAVILSSALTTTIDNCESPAGLDDWVSKNSSAVAHVHVPATDGKQGDTCMQITSPLIPAKNTLYAYKTVNSLDLSSKQKITFWFKNAVTVLADQWRICLCSDTAGATIVDSFIIPAVACYDGYTMRWQPLTLSQTVTTLTGVVFSDGGGGSSVIGTYASHGLRSGQSITISGTTDYNNTYTITVTGADTFTIATAWIGGADNIGNIRLNLGANIKSVALYSGNNATVPTTNKYVRLDNIQATTTNGINLQSLISKNSAEQGGTEGWYGIQSINGTVVLLDQSTATKSDSTYISGYFGASAAADAVYIRETIKTSMAASNGAIIQAVQNSGSLAGGNISFLGGYNTSSANNCDGETYFDGLNGMGYGIYATAKSYITFSNINTYRYDTGYYLTSASHYCTIQSSSNINNNSTTGLYVNSCNYFTITALANTNSNGGGGIGFTSSLYGTFTTIGNVTNNAGIGIDIYGMSFSTFNTITNASGNQGGFGVCLRPFSSSFSVRNKIMNLTANYNSNYGIRLYDQADNNLICNLSTTGNITGGVYCDGQNNYFRNSLINESSEIVQLSSQYDYYIYSWNHDRVAGHHKIFTDGGTIDCQDDVVYTAGGFAWRFIPAATRIAAYPLKLKIAEIAVVSGRTYTISAYLKLDHSTNVAAKLVIPGGYLSGISTDVTANTPTNTNWNKVSLAAITPTETGILPVEVWAWYVAGLSNIYVDTLSIE